jgi:antitoxin (DNA-binding transcriptional repressor) of toxin-antitoxin stability system
MKSISIRELHRSTGTWVRSARKYGSIVVRDRNTPVATLTPITEEPLVNVFKRWKPLKRFSTSLDKPVGGTRVEDIISLDRDR